MSTKRKTMTSIPVSERALFQRINRALKKDGEILKATRGERARQELGAYFTIDTRNYITRGDIDLEKLGRELGALKPYEHLESEK